MLDGLSCLVELTKQPKINELKELGYISKYVRVNARNYGIPQNRPRLLMLSVFVGDDLEKEEKIKKYFVQVLFATTSVH